MCVYINICIYIYIYTHIHNAMCTLTIIISINKKSFSTYLNLAKTRSVEQICLHRSRTAKLRAAQPVGQARPANIFRFPCFVASLIIDLVLFDK